MEKKKLMAMAGAKGFISGIYNYCDRWCERCPQTSRCLNYSIAADEFVDPETRDVSNDAFWKKLSGIFEDTVALLRERAAAEGLDLNTIDLDKLEEEEQLVAEAADGHESSRDARFYGEMTEDWFKNAEPLFEENQTPGPQFRFPAGNNEGAEKDEIDDALEVIRWYQNQIYAKIMRAVSGAIEEKKEPHEGLDQYARDSDGSAKVALIGIDRSMAAWGIINNRFPNPEIRHIIAHLDRLRRRIENDFPDARAFIRPGFDSIDLNS